MSLEEAKKKLTAAKGKLTRVTKALGEKQTLFDNAPEDQKAGAQQALDEAQAAVDAAKQEVAEAEKAKANAVPDTPKAKFFRVRFHAKSNPNATDQVTLGCNGEIMVIQRETEVVLPERFLEVADNAISDHFRQLPGKSRKVIAKVQTFPYTRLGEATEAEYNTMRRAGDKATKEHVAAHGLDEVSD